MQVSHYCAIPVTGMPLVLPVDEVVVPRGEIINKRHHTKSCFYAICFYSYFCTTLRLTCDRHRLPAQDPGVDTITGASTHSDPVNPAALNNYTHLRENTLDGRIP